MLTYVYQCAQGHVREARQSIQDDAFTTCPDPACDAPAQRVIQPVPVLYIGEGWPRKDGAADARVEKRLAAGDVPKYEYDDYYSPGEGHFGPPPGM